MNLDLAVAFVIIVGWFWLIWSVNQLLKAPAVYVKQRNEGRR